MFKLTQKILCIFLFMVLCLAAGGAAAQEELIWPVETKFMAKDWNSDDYRACLLYTSPSPRDRS